MELVKAAGDQRPDLDVSTGSAADFFSDMVIMTAEMEQQVCMQDLDGDMVCFVPGEGPETMDPALAADGVVARVQNAGVSGDTSAAGRQRLTYVLDNAKVKPTLIVLGLGGNDMLRGIGPDQTRANLDAMLAELQRRDIPVLLTGMMAAPNLGSDYADKFNAIFPDLAAKYDVSFYPFILDNVVTNKALMLGDNLHPNARGVKVVADALAPLVEQALPEAE